MNTLSLTFRGPHLFVVPPPDDGVLSPVVLIYAPKCQGHSGSVFYGDGALSLFGRMREGGKFPYILTGPVPNQGCISYQWNTTALGVATNPILSPETLGGSCYPTNQDLLDSANYCIRVPRPKIYYALNTVSDTEVVKSGDYANNFGQLATGFRLYYDWAPGADICLREPSSTPPAPLMPGDLCPGDTITPPTGKGPGDPANWLPLPCIADIEFQYERSGGDDVEHRDAMDCFDQIAKLLGLDWWVNFQTAPGSSGGAAFHSGGDCMALPIAVGINN